jgi:hypothetical protein
MEAGGIGYILIRRFIIGPFVVSAVGRLSVRVNQVRAGEGQEIHDQRNSAACSSSAVPAAA